MALYALGDLHISLSGKRNMEIYGDKWKNHLQRIEENCLNTVGENDTIVFTGDQGFENNIKLAMADLKFIEKLPGKKILLRGNHDYYWKVNKTDLYNEMFDGKLFFLQNNFYSYNEYGIVGTKGICLEERESFEHFVKILKLEASRLRQSIELARQAGFEKFVIFLHYPPNNAGETKSVFTDIAKEINAEFVVYSHLHSEMHFEEGIQGVIDGCSYKLVSSDYVDFMPQKILD